MRGYALIESEFAALISEVNEYYRKQGLRGQPTTKTAELRETLDAAKAELIKILEASEGYWSTPEGVSHGVELLSIFLVYSMARQIAVEVGRKSGIAVLRWVTMEDSSVCDECWALAGDYSPDEPLPERPHYGCRCRIVLVFREK